MKKQNEVKTEAKAEAVEQKSVSGYVRKPREFKEKSYVLFAEGKGFLIDNGTSLPKVGLSGNLLSFNDKFKAQFAASFFTENCKLADRILVMMAV